MDITSVFPESVAVIITQVIAVCAAIAVVLPAPAENGNVAYRIVYKVIQWVGMNLGRAANAQDKK